MLAMILVVVSLRLPVRSPEPMRTGQQLHCNAHRLITRSRSQTIRVTSGFLWKARFVAVCEASPRSIANKNLIQRRIEVDACHVAGNTRVNKNHTVWLNRWRTSRWQARYTQRYDRATVGRVTARNASPPRNHSCCCCWRRSPVLSPTELARVHVVALFTSAALVAAISLV